MTFSAFFFKKLISWKLLFPSFHEHEIDIKKLIDPVNPKFKFFHTTFTGANIACVASVSVGLSAGLKHFSLFERVKIGASAFSRLPSPSPQLPSVLRSPQFLRRQKAKTASNGRKTLRKRLLRRLTLIRWN